MIKRYDHEDKCGGEYSCSMRERDDGDYVEYADYLKLQDTCCNLLAACKAFIKLSNDSDMRPEDECYELHVLIEQAIAQAEKKA